LVAASETVGIGLQAPVLAFVGPVRPHQNEPRLIASFRALPEPPFRLLATGKPNSLDLTPQLQVTAVDDPRICL
jgi:beta-1,4-mannosyltransferase